MLMIVYSITNSIIEPLEIDMVCLSMTIIEFFRRIKLLKVNHFDRIIRLLVRRANPPLTIILLLLL
jgi:hypothetical protein